MKTYHIKKSLFLLLTGALLGTTSCVNDLDTQPLDKDELVSNVVFKADINAYTESLAKIYAGMVIGGNKGGDADQDVKGIDGGSQASFIRVLWNMQELASDMAHCAWNDPGIPDFNHLSWDSSSPWIKGSYYRLAYQINLANAFLRETTDDKLSSRGCSNEVKNTIKEYRAEARFLRALTYMYALDLYRNYPFFDENSPIGSKRPQQIMKDDLYKYVEKELLESEKSLAAPVVGWNENYGHANKAAAWAALSRLYLNAETYVGQKKYTECITYCKKIINAGYELEPKYADMFKADNDHSKEMIFPLRYEGDQTMTWGGMTALLCWGSSQFQEETNAKGGWQGVRAKSSLLKLFTNENEYKKDTRFSMLRLDGTKNVEIVKEGDFKDNGIPVTKFCNLNKNGSKPASNEAYVDFPLFRLGEIYLNLAEAVLRGGKGVSKNVAMNYLNELRKRAYKDKTVAPIDDNNFTLKFLLDERGRELFFEAQRRTDLVRFGKYTSGDYVWPWKGGEPEGKAVNEKYKVFPLPSDDIGSNLNLKQNDGY